MRDARGKDTLMKDWRNKSKKERMCERDGVLGRGTRQIALLTAFITMTRINVGCVYFLRHILFSAADNKEKKSGWTAKPPNLTQQQQGTLSLGRFL